MGGKEDGMGQENVGSRKEEREREERKRASGGEVEICGEGTQTQTRTQNKLKNDQYPSDALRGPQPIT